ncbi:hypothetical protein [Streptomyces sp. NPDC088554]|uniref:hypothetical protein n=1 Tax=Streptomyces sp. NPDC088554 TaxID=3365865 RepID=UPI0037FCCFDD
MTTKSGIPIFPQGLGWLRCAVSDWGGDWTVARVQDLFKSRFGKGLYKSDARVALYVLRGQGVLVLNDTDPNRHVYTPAASTHQEKDTPVPGAEFTPDASVRGIRTAVLIGIATALREHPTAVRLLARSAELEAESAGPEADQ